MANNPKLRVLPLNTARLRALKLHLCHLISCVVLKEVVRATAYINKISFQP